MGHFVINLPDHKLGDVRWGQVFKKRFSLFRGSKSESKKGCIIHIADSGSQTEYRFFRSQRGEWFKDPDGQIKLDEADMPIKHAIVQKEKELNLF